MYWKTHATHYITETINHSSNCEFPERFKTKTGNASMPEERCTYTGIIKPKNQFSWKIQNLYNFGLLELS